MERSEEEGLERHRGTGLRVTKPLAPLFPGLAPSLLSSEVANQSVPLEASWSLKDLAAIPHNAVGGIFRFPDTMVQTVSLQDWTSDKKGDQHAPKPSSQQQTFK